MFRPELVHSLFPLSKFHQIWENSVTCIFLRHRVSIKFASSIFYSLLLCHKISDIYRNLSSHNWRCNWYCTHQNIDMLRYHCLKRVRIRSYSGGHFFLIFPHSDWLRRDREYLSVFSPNAGKCGKMWTRITPYTDTFYAVYAVTFKVGKFVLVFVSCLRGKFGINLPSSLFRNFEIFRVKRGRFQNFKKWTR